MQQKNYSLEMMRLIENKIPVWKKFALTVNESAEYFGIGDKKLRKIIQDNSDSDFILQNGSKTLIKRMKFEEFLNNTTSI